MGITVLPNTGLQKVAAGDTNWNAASIAFNADKIETWFASSARLLEANGGTGASSMASITPTAGFGVTVPINNNFTATVSGTGVITLTGPVQPSVSVEAAVGSSGGYSFAGDTNTLLYRSAADEITLRTGGTDALIIDSSGNVDVDRTGAVLQLQSTRMLSIIGTDNTFVRGGNETLTGTKNTAVGASAGQAITTANWNTSIGNAAGAAVTEGNYNTSFGHGAGSKINTGTQNVSLGALSGLNLTTGQNNTLSGHAAGDNLTTGSGNIIIGANVDADSATGNNQLNIGDTIKGDVVSGHIQILNELQVGTATGNFKGSGTANFAADIYKNDSAYTNPDYVFEFAAKGKIEEYRDHEGAATYDGLQPIEALEAYVLKHHHFPLIPREALGAFGRSDALLAITEELFLYITQLHYRLKKLEP